MQRWILEHVGVAHDLQRVVAVDLRAALDEIDLRPRRDLDQAPPGDVESVVLLEELYLFFDMPSPAFGVQFVYTDAGDPELAAVVREGDAVLMPRGYHPNVSVPGHAINFVWLMAARREVQDRVFGVVNVQPEFKQGGSGLEASRR